MIVMSENNNGDEKNDEKRKEEKLYRLKEKYKLKGDYKKEDYDGWEFGFGENEVL